VRGMWRQTGRARPSGGIGGRWSLANSPCQRARIIPLYPVRVQQLWPLASAGRPEGLRASGTVDTIVSGENAMQGTTPPEPETRAAGERPLVQRAYETRAEISVRHIELTSVSERLDHVAAVSRAQRWGVRGQLLLGGGVGGVVGFVPFIASGPEVPFIVAYVVLVGAAMLLAWLHREAESDVAAERVDSVLAIKEHIDKTMLPTETPRLQAPTQARRLAAPAASLASETPLPPPHSPAEG
jgi:hypothetical protein